MDILEHARAQRIGGMDGEMLDALCSEIERLRKLAVVIEGDETEPAQRREYARRLLPLNAAAEARAER